MNLRELVEMASEHTEAVYDPSTVMMMRHLCITPDDKLAVYVCPVQSVDEEVMFRKIIPLSFPRKYLRWCFVSEAWSAEGMKPGDPLPANHPARFEIVAFLATEGKTGETLAAHRQIYRPAIGGAKLLPLVFDSREPLFMMDTTRR